MADDITKFIHYTVSPFTINILLSRCTCIWDTVHRFPIMQIRDTG